MGDSGDAVGGDGGATDGGADGGTGDGGLSEDCAVDAAFFATFTPSLALAETVIRVDWATGQPAEVRVAYDDGERSLVTPWSPPAQDGVASVLGLRPDIDVDLRLEARVDGVVACSETRQVRTGSLPSNLPEATLTEHDANISEGGWLTVAVVRAQDSFATIIDDHGRFVWAWPVPGIYRATLSRDRQSMLAIQPPRVWNGVGVLARIGLSVPDGGDEQSTIEVTGAHTDFIELPDGTIATLGWTARTFDAGSRRLLGDTIIEVSPDGSTRTVWDVFDHFDPSLATVYAESPVSDGASPLLEEWSHINSIHYDEASDDYLLTSTFNHAVIRVDRATGDVVWVLADDDEQSDWRIDSPQREIQLPHSAQLLSDDRVLVFSRGPIGEVGTPCAWVSELSVDPTTGDSEVLWHWATDDCLVVGFLGQARRSVEEHTWTIWSSAGRITETDERGILAWQLDLDLGAAFGYGRHTPTLY